MDSSEDPRLNSNEDDPKVYKIKHDAPGFNLQSESAATMKEVRNWDQRKQKQFVKLNSRLKDQAVISKNKSYFNNQTQIRVQSGSLLNSHGTTSTDEQEYSGSVGGGVKIRTTVMSRDPTNKLSPARLQVEKVEDQQRTSTLEEDETPQILKSPQSPITNSPKQEPDVGQAYLNAILEHNDDKKEKKNHFIKEFDPVLKRSRQKRHTVSTGAESLTITVRRDDDVKPVDVNANSNHYSLHAETTRATHKSLFSQHEKNLLAQKGVRMQLPNRQVPVNQKLMSLNKEQDTIMSGQGTRIAKKRNLFDVESIKQYKMQLPDLNLRQDPSHSPKTSQIQTSSAFVALNGSEVMIDKRTDNSQQYKDKQKRKSSKSFHQQNAHQSQSQVSPLSNELITGQAQKGHLKSSEQNKSDIRILPTNAPAFIHSYQEAAVSLPKLQTPQHVQQSVEDTQKKLKNSKTTRHLYVNEASLQSLQGPQTTKNRMTNSNSVQFLTSFQKHIMTRDQKTIDAQTQSNLNGYYGDRLAIHSSIQYKEDPQRNFMHPNFKLRSSHSYGDPKAPKHPPQKLALIKTNRNGLPVKTNKDEFNEDLKGEVLKKKAHDHSQKQRRKQSQTKLKDDMATDEATEILSQLDPKFVQKVLPIPSKAAEKLKVVSPSLEFARGIQPIQFDMNIPQESQRPYGNHNKSGIQSSGSEFGSPKSHSVFRVADGNPFLSQRQASSSSMLKKQKYLNMQENHRNKLDAFRQSSTRLVDNDSEEGERIIFLNRHNANAASDTCPHHSQAGQRFSEIKACICFKHSKHTVSTSVSNVPSISNDFNQKFKNLKLESKFQKRKDSAFQEYKVEIGEHFSHHLQKHNPSQMNSMHKMKSVHKIDVGLDQVLVNRAKTFAKKEVREIKLNQQGPYGTGGLETDNNSHESPLSGDRRQVRQQFDALKVLAQVKSLFQGFKTRHEEILRQDVVNGGTGEETVTLQEEAENSNEVTSQKTQNQRQVIDIQEHRTNTDVFMGTRDLHNNFDELESEGQNSGQTPLRISVPQAQVEKESDKSNN